LAAYEQIFKKSDFQIFGNLGHSHKLALLPVRKIEKIQELASEAVEKKYNVAQLKERAKEVNKENKETKKTKSITLKALQEKQDLDGASLKKLERLDEQAKKKIDLYKEELETLEKQLVWITEVIRATPPDEKKTKKTAKTNKVVKLENGRKEHESKKAKAA
jgi:hypothetical protein